MRAGEPARRRAENRPHQAPHPSSHPLLHEGGVRWWPWVVASSSPKTTSRCAAAERARRLERYRTSPPATAREARQAVEVEKPEVVNPEIMPRLDGMSVCPLARGSRGPHPGAHAHRRPRVERPGGRPRRRGRRLPGEALRSRGNCSPGCGPCRAAPASPRGGGAQSRRSGASPRGPPGAGGSGRPRTRTESDLVELLMVNAGIGHAPPPDLRAHRDDDFETTSNSLDVYVGYLRRKTEAEVEPRPIHRCAVRRRGAAVSLRLWVTPSRPGGGGGGDRRLVGCLRRGGGRSPRRDR